MENPFFSIIVVAYNAAETIEKTIRSVLNQSFRDYEIVVKDAASTDGTLEKIPASDRIYIYSKKDGGIYDGMNEAIAYAKGKYFLFLNCGDCLADTKVLSKVYDFINTKTEKIDVVYGDYVRNGVLFKQPSQLSKFYLYRTPLCHQSIFFVKGIFEKYGLYDTSFKILADYDITLKTYVDKAVFQYCGLTVCSYMGGGVSESKSGSKLKKEEYKIIQERYLTKKERKKYAVKLFFSFRGLRQKLISDKSPKWIRKLYRTLVNKVNK